MADQIRFKKKFCTMSVVSYWNRLPEDIVDIPSLEVFQGQVRWGFEQPGLVESDRDVGNS